MNTITLADKTTVELTAESLETWARARVVKAGFPESTVAETEVTQAPRNELIICVRLGGALTPTQYQELQNTLFEALFDDIDTPAQLRRVHIVHRA